MDRDRHNALVALAGTFQVDILDEEGNVKRSYKSENVITNSGISQFVDMLLDIHSTTLPRTYEGGAGPTERISVLSDVNDFGGVSGEIFGLKFIDWPGRNKSQFGIHRYQNASYLQNGSFISDGDPKNPTVFNSGFNSNTYWTPGGNFATDGWCLDLGWTNVSKEIFNAPDNTQLHPLQNKNAYYDVSDPLVTNEAEDTTYTQGVDYIFDVGDGVNFAKIQLINAGLIGQNLKVSYSYYDVPQEPVVGFGMRVGGSSTWGAQTFQSAFCFSFNQGQSIAEPFFPWVTGEPNKPAYQSHQWDWPWYPSWQIVGDPHYYFQTMLPWAMINPTQMVMFGNTSNHDKYYFDFQLIGMNLPKLGPHCIALGTGGGSPTATDTALFSESIRMHTTNKASDGTTSIKMSALLDYDEGNGVTFTEAGLFFPSNANEALFKDEDYFVGGYYGMSENAFSGNGRLVKLEAPNAQDCDTMSAHTMFPQSWSKNSSERAQITYTLNMNW
jgi:hypothetical protein